MKLTRRRALLLLGGGVGAVLFLRLYNPFPYLKFAKFALLPRRSQKGEVPAMKANPFIRQGKALIAMVQGNEVPAGVATALGLLGAGERLEAKGKRVLVKPNVNSDDPFPGTTNPALVGAVVSWLYKAGAKEVIVGDCSNARYHPSVRTMEKLGIKRAAEEAGARVVGFEAGEWVEVRPPQARYLTNFAIPKLLYETDLLVQIPVVKTHHWATYTMSLKNLVGVIHPKDRIGIHSGSHLEEAIAEISLAVRSDLIVMDGTRTMVAGGPFSGPTVDTGLILAGGDPVAMDLVGLGIIKHFRQWERVSAHSLWEQRQIKRAWELGLGVGRGEEVEILTQALDPKGQGELLALAAEIQEYLQQPAVRA